MYAFALERRWIIRHVLVAAVLGLFLLAMFWQIHRLHERRAANARIRAALALPPVDLGRSSAAPVWRRAIAHGRYDVSQEVVVRSRVLDDEAGNDVLTPLLLGGGQAVLVDRGWVPIEFDAGPVLRAAPPSGEVTVTGELLPPERKRPFAPEDPPRGHLRALSRINIARLRRQVPYGLLDAYLLAENQEPPQTRSLPRPQPPPLLTDGPHLSYAIQWLLFTVIGASGYAAFLRREAARRKRHKLAPRPGSVPT